MPQSRFSLQHYEGFSYLDEGPSQTETPPLLLLHGMLGDLSNWDPTIGALSDAGYRVLVPVLPVYDLPMAKSNVEGLAGYARAFAEALDLSSVVLAGNSLGGQVALLYALRAPRSVAAMILSGSSGIYEQRMDADLMRRDSRDFIRERAAVTFYDDVHVTDELVEEMYELVNDRERAVRLIRMARSTKQDTVTEQLSRLTGLPTLLVWGCDDVITPPDVAEEFRRRLPQAQLHFIDKCGHAPMIERPEEFNRLALDFLAQTLGPSEQQVPREPHRR
jgi:pimeloyl-ACP methyl ester carboxylesterase